MNQNELNSFEQRLRDLENKVNSHSNSPLYSIWNFGIWVIVTIILIFVLATTFIRIQNLLEDDSPQVYPASQSDIALKRANEAVDSVEIVLSFLEGASVLLAVALSAATLYGIRQSRELREEIESKLADITKAQQYIQNKEPQLNALDNLEQNLRKSLSDSQETLKEIINDVSRLLQADQEFRLRNHKQAYKFVSQVLEHDDVDEPNDLALYIAGWLEVHHIAGKLEIGLHRLENLTKSSPDWASAKAAYGVALRRKAMKLQKTDRTQAQNLLHQAHGTLMTAIGLDPNLVDFNRESFWGPIGGILRDMNNIDSAIDAYQNALRVTPGSSYPQGNLANLYLFKTKIDSQFQEAMLDAFEKTLIYARAELNQTPNDYFLIMDIAMAETILGYKDKKKLDSAQENLQQALQMNTSAELLGVSNRGWTFLRNSLPEGRQWNSVRQTLDTALNHIAEAIKNQEI